jgi:hypothetical protein
MQQSVHNCLVDPRSTWCVWNARRPDLDDPTDLLLRSLGIQRAALMCPRCHVTHDMWRPFTETGPGAKLIPILVSYARDGGPARAYRRDVSDINKQRALCNAAISQVKRWPKVALGAVLHRFHHAQRDFLTFIPAEVRSVGPLRCPAPRRAAPRCATDPPLRVSSMLTTHSTRAPALA